jgi:hypothetical protein
MGFIGGTEPAAQRADGRGDRPREQRADDRAGNQAEEEPDAAAREEETERLRALRFTFRSLRMRRCSHGYARPIRY